MRIVYFCRAMRPQHWRLAQVIEMIHTASLIHDDVLDESDTRRGGFLFSTDVSELFYSAACDWYIGEVLPDQSMITKC